MNMPSPRRARKKSSAFSQLLLVLLVIALAVIPLVLQREAKFTGTDDQAKNAISTINQDYRPWFTPLWKPPSGEVESLLFSLQAAIGAGVIGYILGFLHGRKKKVKDT